MEEGKKRRGRSSIKIKAFKRNTSLFQSAKSAQCRVISDDDDDRRDTTRSRNSSSVTPNKGGLQICEPREYGLLPLWKEPPTKCELSAARNVFFMILTKWYQDIDIVMSSHTCDLELLKRILVTENPHHFQLVDAKTPSATWKVLWYQDYVEGKLAKIKVDILKPGVLHLPMIFSEAIVDRQGLPVVPISILLLHKLQGWKDNMDSDLPRLLNKQDADVGVLKTIIEGMSMHERTNATHWKRFALERFDEGFRGDTERRVELFCESFPEYQEMWKTLGW
ncbi:hypothetical protein ARMGADRAFT_1061763 [Armillaria gallica]|uniref:Uncharacterized protein n=1 Tax=Armillaria gallica TaxID=47427 RepID=A0A2H3DQA0_ARMGA|nr:hypothetical protein ARMGADRAFT_1061763 [Armillaria gallica]